MKLEPEVVGIAGGAGMVAHFRQSEGDELPFHYTGTELVCRDCGAASRASGAVIDAKTLQHLAGCEMGELVRLAGKPVVIRLGGGLS